MLCTTSRKERRMPNRRSCKLEARVRGSGSLLARIGNEEDGNGGAGFAGLVRRPFPFLALLAVLVALLLTPGCAGGEDDEARQASSPPPGGSTVEVGAQAESLEDEPFTLNQRLPVPPRFEAAYQRKAPIVVEFFQQGQDPYYPQGLEVDEMVNEDLTALRDEYPGVEFFTYDIDDPGDAGTGEDLQRGEYGSLATQLDVGYTPFVAMLEPLEEGYVIRDVFEGYVDRAVLDQALYELANT